VKPRCIASIVTAAAVVLALALGFDPGMQARPPDGGPCCSNTPPQCTAAGACYCAGECVDPLNMCVVEFVLENPCHWTACDH
jgi:hypothetical protein